MSDQIVPAGATELEVIEVRDGAFGVEGTGDTSGFGGLTRPVTMPAAATQPFGSWYDEVHDRLADLVSTGSTTEDAGATTEDAGVGAIEKVVIDRGEITFFIRREALPAVVKHLRDDDKLRFEFCSSVSGVHYPHESGRELHVIYHLLSMSYRRRLRLEVTTPDDDRHIPSVVAVYPTADWHERETWDFFGVVFDGHPALTRILMPDDWIGHPQRKDYPLGGIPVEYKGGTTPPPDQRRSYS